MSEVLLYRRFLRVPTEALTPATMLPRMQGCLAYENAIPVEPSSSTMPRALRWPWEGAVSCELGTPVIVALSQSGRPSFFLPPPPLSRVA